MSELERLRRRAERERAARKQAEEILEEKSRALYEANAQLSQSRDELDARVQQRTALLRQALTQAEAATEQALLNSAYGDILEQTLNEIYIIDAETLQYVHVNKGARENLGYRLAELQQMTAPDVMPRYAESRFLEVTAPLHTGERSHLDFSTTHRRRDGSTYPVIAHIEASTLRNRSVYVAIVLDITQRRQAEEEIHRLSVAVEQSPSGVLISDAQGAVEYVNTTYTRMTGYTPADDQAGPPRLSEAINLTDQQIEEMWATIGAGKVWRGEFRGGRGDGAWLSASISAIRNAEHCVTHCLAVLQDVTESRDVLEQLETLAYHDDLTGLPNRSAILRMIQHEIDRGDDNHFALLFLDFDRFKLINDSLGHERGDELLRRISDRLRRRLRRTDEVVSARLGGDEFVVLLKNIASPDAATLVAQRLLRSVGRSYKLGGHTVQSTASIGVVTNDRGYASAGEMLRDADLAMYEAKARGKDCYVVFDESMHERAQERLQLECDLRQAIAQDQLVLHYQPIVSLQGGELEGVEALVRWRHPELGMVSPDSFIPIAEETQLIVPIGAWVLDEACRQFSAWRAEYGADAPSCIHVNVSRLQMLMSDFPDLVQQTLKRHEMDPRALHLEVTESVIMHDPDTIASAMHTLRDAGVRIDMDDFGTGYSSLACLHEFPIDVLKIDRSFVNNKRYIRDYVALLHSILSLADNLGLQVVAEGIETPEQLATLQALGCTFGQGHYFSRALPAADLAEYIQQQNADAASTSLVVGALSDSHDAFVRSLLPGEANA